MWNANFSLPEKLCLLVFLMTMAAATPPERAYASDDAKEVDNLITRQKELQKQIEAAKKQVESLQKSAGTERAPSHGVPSQVGPGLVVEDMGGQQMDDRSSSSLPGGGGGLQMSPAEAQQVMQQLQQLKKQIENQNKVIQQLEKEEF